MQKLSVLLASDFPMLRDSITECLNAVPEMQVVASTDADSEVLGLAKTHNPSVALLDLSVDWAALCELVSGLSTYQVLPLLMSDKFDDLQTIELLRRGVCGVIPRRATPDILRKSVRAIGSGEIWITRKTVTRILDRVQNRAGKSAEGKVAGIRQMLPQLNPAFTDPLQNRYNLTRREMQMVQALAEGMTNKDIATEFGISESTVKHHLTSIFDKVGVDSRLELATFVTFHGLVGSSAAASSPQPVA
jgi:two-component system nitrate/nitrite response regulator NarL